MLLWSFRPPTRSDQEKVSESELRSNLWWQKFIDMSRRSRRQQGVETAAERHAELRTGQNVQSLSETKRRRDLDWSRLVCPSVGWNVPEAEEAQEEKSKDEKSWTFDLFW